jgi:hypothetical protein
MRMQKTALALLAVTLLTRCGGEHLSSVTAPKNISCDAAFGGDWHWVLQTCAGGTDGVSPGQLSTTNGCRLTLDTTPAALKAQGQTFTMVLAFDTKKVTLERKGTVCDAIDNGTIESQSGRSFGVHFTATKTSQCCNNDYFATLAY